MVHKGDRQTGAGILSASTGIVGSQTAVKIVGPACVEGAVGTGYDIGIIHGLLAVLTPAFILRSLFEGREGASRLFAAADQHHCDHNNDRPDHKAHPVGLL